MRVVQGLQEVQRLLDRRHVPQSQEVPQGMTARIREIFGRPLTPAQVVAQIIADVRSKGDVAVREYTHRLDEVRLTSLEVPPERFASAYHSVEPKLVEALKVAAQRIREFHQSTLSKSWIDSERGLGELVTPLERVGLYVPGGTAAYPSTVLMGTIPAKVAGVDEVIMCTPPGKGGTPPAATLVAADLAGVDRVFQIGGAQAITAMAYGTESVPRVDKICGPGNLFVALAKREVFGQVDIDGLYGPTETLLIADDSADPRLCAADLLAQAEHDPLAYPVLVTTSGELAQAVAQEVARRIEHLERREIAQESLEGQGVIAVVQSLDEAFALANEFAPEHLCLLLRDPWTYVKRVRHAGGVFVGEMSPEAMGDYIAGPSHVMPTGGTARFASYLGVHHFLKRSLVVGLDAPSFRQLAPSAAIIARAEGLDGHAQAIEIRQELPE